MSDLVLTVKAPFIDTATEAYLQLILPGYESKEESDECIELYRRGTRRRTVSKTDILCAVLLDEFMDKTLTDKQYVAAAKEATAKKIIRRIKRAVGGISSYRRHYLPYSFRSSNAIEDLCTQAL